MNEIPKGLCQCGCGKQTLLARYNDYKRGYTKGEPQRFYPGHYKTRKDRRQVGQRYLDLTSGYVKLYLPDHPNVHKSGHYGEHQYVMEQMLGRLLEPDEEVHHKDRNRQNNDPANLQLFSSSREHVLLLHHEEEKEIRSWAGYLGFAQCLRCASTDHPHFTRGYCKKCYHHLYYKGLLPPLPEGNRTKRPRDGSRARAHLEGAQNISKCEVRSL